MGIAERSFAIPSVTQGLGVEQPLILRLLGRIRETTDEELFRLFGEHKHKRGDSVYDGLSSWLENAEREHDLGGIMLGTGLDSGSKGETDDLVLLGPVLYRRRWSQYVDDDGTLERADTPAPIRGTRPVRNPGKGS